MVRATHRMCVCLWLYTSTTVACNRLPDLPKPDVAAASTHTSPPPDGSPSMEPAAPLGLPATPTLPGLHVQNGQLLTRDGNSVALHGVIWGGFESGDMLKGFPQSTSMSGDFATVVRRLYLLGFNAVRLPFSFHALHTPCEAVGTACSWVTQQELSQSVTPPNTAAPAVLPELPHPPSRTPQRCNDYIPSGDTFARFVWVVNFFASNGFYVVLVDDLHDDDSATNDPTDWVAQWQTLVGAVSQNDTVAEHVLVDLLNEPDVDNVQWTKQEDTPGVTQLYLAAMDALAPSSKVLFLVQGTGQGGIGANWGDGYDTNPNDIRYLGIGDPNPFFTTLLSRPYADRVLLAPHVFAPDVTYNNTDSAGPPLYNRLSKSFGYLTQTGYCADPPCRIFPAVIGAFGSAFAQANAQQTMHDVAQYLQNIGNAADGLHAPITHWFYWQWDSTSVGALLHSDGTTLQWNKITYLNTLGLQPWQHTAP